MASYPDGSWSAINYQVRPLLLLSAVKGKAVSQFGLHARPAANCRGFTAYRARPQSALVLALTTSGKQPTAAVCAQQLPDAQQHLSMVW